MINPPEAQEKPKLPLKSQTNFLNTWLCIGIHFSTSIFLGLFNPHSLQCEMIKTLTMHNNDTTLRHFRVGSRIRSHPQCTLVLYHFNIVFPPSRLTPSYPLSFFLVTFFENKRKRKRKRCRDKLLATLKSKSKLHKSISNRNNQNIYGKSIHFYSAIILLCISQQIYYCTLFLKKY
jgi:hypothetical protein